MRSVLKRYTPYVILDGKIVSADRCHEQTVSRKGGRSTCGTRGRRRAFGGNIQGLYYPDGLPMWIADVLPGNVHDLAAAREKVLAVRRNYTDEMPGLADCGYEGAGHGVLTPVKKPKGVSELDINARTRNMLLSSARCLGKEGLRCFPSGVKRCQRWTNQPEAAVMASTGKSCALASHRLARRWLCKASASGRRLAAEAACR